jgi:membrane protein DedA with SNARE-associated domain
MAWPRFLFFNAAGGIVWATLYGLLYYFFGSVLSKLSTTINVTLAVVGLLLIVAFIVWSRRKEHELLERAEREVGGSVAQELGEDEPAA